LQGENQAYFPQNAYILLLPSATHWSKIKKIAPLVEFAIRT